MHHLRLLQSAIVGRPKILSAKTNRSVVASEMASNAAQNVTKAKRVIFLSENYVFLPLLLCIVCVFSLPDNTISFASINYDHLGRRESLIGLSLQGRRPLGYTRCDAAESPQGRCPSMADDIYMYEVAP